MKQLPSEFGDSHGSSADGHVVLARCSEFPCDHVSDPHIHDEAQFVLTAEGAMIMHTDGGALMIPANRAAWIPGGMVHNARMIGPVSTMTIWVEQIPEHNLPDKARIVDVSPTMRRLLLEAMKTKPRMTHDGGARRAVRMLLKELEAMPALPDTVPLPTTPTLVAKCQSFLRHPSVHQTIDEWSTVLRMSRRTFTRRFRYETGLSFAEWRQRACVLTVLPRLAAGESITTIAIELGYESPTAFTTMFKRQRGLPPSRYF